MQRFLPYNYDGSSCFFNSLFCALFFPVKLGVMDPYLLLGHRADMTDTTREHLCSALRVVASCIRGSREGHKELCIAFRPVITQFLYKLANINFTRGQHDPIDLFEALLRVYNVGGVFTTKKTIQSQYNNGNHTTSVMTDQMFRYSATMHSSAHPLVRFERLFPHVETLTVDNQEADQLTHQKTIIEFGGGPVLIITRESFQKKVHYGRWSASTNAYVLPILNTIEKSVQWYELQSVLCWKGHMTAAGEVGHYVCFVYDDTKWYFYNDLMQKGDGLAGLDAVEQPEAFSEYLPSETGTMFIYAKVACPPSDVYNCKEEESK